MAECVPLGGDCTDQTLPCCGGRFCADTGGARFCR